MLAETLLQPWRHAPSWTLHEVTIHCFALCVFVCVLAGGFGGVCAPTFSMLKHAFPWQEEHGGGGGLEGDEQGQGGLGSYALVMLCPETSDSLRQDGAGKVLGVGPGGYGACVRREMVVTAKGVGVVDVFQVLAAGRCGKCGGVSAEREPTGIHERETVGDGRDGCGLLGLGLLVEGATELHLVHSSLGALESLAVVVGDVCCGQAAAAAAAVTRTSPHN